MLRLTRRAVTGALTMLLWVSTAPRANPQTPLGPAASQAAAARRPLRMLVLGDSVMWGQGLQDENKFSYKVRDWLCQQRGGGTCLNKEDVQIHVEAHSGATLARPKKVKEKEEERFNRAVAPVRYYGEVNNALPTLFGQLKLARHHYAKNSILLGEVDLVLVNGGINDLNAATLLVHKLLGGDVTERVGERFAPMKNLLMEVADTFPNAIIVVPGYFPLVSERTPETVISDTVRKWLFGRKDEKKLMEKAVKEEERRTPDGGKASRKKSKPSRILTMMAARSREFVDASNNFLERAVNDLNKGYPPLRVAAAGSPSPHAEVIPRALFVRVDFRPENAYGVEKHSYLWQVGGRGPNLTLKCADDNILTMLVVNDEMQEDRPCMCDHAGRRSDQVCFRAGAFHPNTLGANAYFEAIRDKLTPLVVSTGWVVKD